LHNPRHRRAAALRPSRAKPPTFLAEVSVPPHRGAAIRAAAPEPPEQAVAVLFAVPDRTKAPAKKRNPAAVRRKAQKKAKARGKAPPRGPKLTPALTLPDHAEPLVLAVPKSRSVVKHRPGGFPALLGDWIAGRMQALWDRIGGVPTARPAPRRKKASAQDLELNRLRGENARLKRQMEALLAAPPRPVRKAPSPA
jgi:hypothetical protein